MSVGEIGGVVLGEVAGARLLRPLDRAALGLRPPALAGQAAQQRGLADAVLADDGDLLAGLDEGARNSGTACGRSRGAGCRFPPHGDAASPCRPPRSGSTDTGASSSSIFNLESAMKGSKGMTLLEIAISLAILAIALVALANLFPIGLKASRRASNFSGASILAQRVIENIKRAASVYDIGDKGNSFPN